MKRIYLSIVFWIGLGAASGLLAQPATTAVPEEELVPFREKGKWGFADAGGTPRIKAKYDTVDFFRAGLAVAGRPGKLGLIDPAGSWAVPRRYAAIRFDPRYRRYWLRERKTQDWFIRLEEGQLRAASDLGQDIADLDRLEQQPVLSAVATAHPGYALRRAGEAYELTQPDGTTRRLSGTYDSVYIARPFRLYFRQSGLWGVMSYREEALYQPQFEELEPTVPVFPPQSDRDVYAARRAGQWGLISWERGTLLPFAYDRVERLLHPQRQLFRITQNGRQGFYDLSTGKQYPPTYLRISPFDRRGLALVRTLKGRLGYLRWDGTKYFRD